MPSRRIGLLVNPTSGRGKGGRSAPEVVQLLESGGVTVVRIEGTDADDAVSRAREAVADGLDALVACGGDGTVHMALQAVMGTDVALGLIPVGSGDDIARVLGIPLGSIRGAVDVVLADHRRVIDAGAIEAADGTRCYFLGVMSSGFDSQVNERANRMTFPTGQAKYLASILATLRVFRPVEYHLDLDGVTEVSEGMLVAVGNGVSYGGGMKICPGAVIDDGELSVVLLGRVSKPTFLRVFPRVFKGTHIEHPAVSERSARSVRIDGRDQIAYADGERVAPLPVTVQVLPRAMTVLAPATAGR